MFASQIASDVSDLKTGLLLKKLLLPNPAFRLHRQYSHSRIAVEAYIAQHFEREYGAQICSFLPMLITMRCKDNYSAAMGIRSATQSTLFLEQYLDQSIEDGIQSLTGRSFHRNEIVEIGNLVATQRGASHLMFILVAAALIRTNVKWMVFTATPQVSKILGRLKFKTITLCEANLNRLEEQHDSRFNHGEWGEYYTTKPQVLAGDLSQTHQLISNNRMIGQVVKHYDDVVTTLSNYLKHNTSNV